MDMVKCELCGQEFSNSYGLARHIVSKHKEITTVEYYEKFTPPKLCGCGCGGFTPIRKGNYRADFIKGHNLNLINKSRIGVKRPKEVVDRIQEKRKGFKMSDEAKKKISEAQKKLWTDKKRQAVSRRVSGENNPNWKGGRPDRKGLYKGNTMENVVDCRRRDNNTCQMCGATKEENRNRNMCVHHIVPYYDSYDNSLDNLICLCEKCHPIADRHKLTKEEIINYYK